MIRKARIGGFGMDRVQRRWLWSWKWSSSSNNRISEKERVDKCGRKRMPISMNVKESSEKEKYGALSVSST